MRNGRSDSSSNLRENAGGLPADGGPQRLLDEIGVALRAGDARQAGQLLIAAYGADQFPERFAIMPELARHLGVELLSKLLSELAAFPCFYCRGGLQRCETCDGRGRLADDLLCERCVGLGAARCDFCYGSGWTSLETLPAALRPFVILQRVRMALNGCRRLLVRADSASESESKGDPRKSAAKRVAAVERQRAMLEDALVSAGGGHFNARLAQELDLLAPACAECVPGVESRLRERLGDLATAAQGIAAANADGSPARLRASSQMSYYDSLRRSDSFAGSGLERPHLRQAVQHILQQKQSPSGAGVNGNSSV